MSGFEEAIKRALDANLEYLADMPTQSTAFPVPSLDNLKPDVLTRLAVALERLADAFTAYTYLLAQDMAETQAEMSETPEPEPPESPFMGREYMTCQ